MYYKHNARQIKLFCFYLLIILGVVIMKNIVGLALTLAILMTFTACNNKKEDTLQNQAKIYYDHLTSQGEIKTEATHTHGG